MDRMTMTTSSQSFFLAKSSALMAMTALTINTNIGDLIFHNLTSNGNMLAYTSSASMTSSSQDKVYLFPKTRNFRERYRRLSHSKWFENTYHGKTLGEIAIVEE